MGSAIVIKNVDIFMSIRSNIPVFGWSSLFLKRILFWNIIPIVIFFFILYYINSLQKYLVVENVVALTEELHIYRAALLKKMTAVSPQNKPFLESEEIKKYIVFLSQYADDVHILYYSPDGGLLMNIRRGVGCDEEEEGCIPPQNNFFDFLYDRLSLIIPDIITEIPCGVDKHIIRVGNNVFNLAKLKKQSPSSSNKEEKFTYIRKISYNHLVTTVAEPIFYKGEKIGYLQFTRDSGNVDEGVFIVHFIVVCLLFVMIGMIFFSSLYFFWSMVYPIRALVYASERMGQRVEGCVDVMPQFLLDRKDGVGILARVLHENIYALWTRVDMIEGFAEEVSHELKNPLASMRSALEILPFIDNEVSRGRLFVIVRDDVCRMQRLIGDILETSRLEGALLREKKEIVNLLPLIYLLVEMQSAARCDEEPYLRFMVKQGKENQFMIWALEDRIVQVMRNIVGNALSFSPKKGTVMITLSLKEEKIAESDKKIELCILDEGPGILEDRFESIFERFYSERPKAEGFEQHSGLGLAMSRQIIEAFGGKIYAENRKEKNLETGEMVIKGAKFIIILPALTPDKIEALTQRPKDPKTQRPKDPKTQN